MGSVLKEKQIQFNLAMKKYEDKSGYRFFGRLVSFTVIFLQTFILFYALRNPVALYLHPVIIVTCYILADFFNGLVHMYMDNNDNYNSVFGPFIASFHLHHKTPRYNTNPVWKVYINESGSKIWLAVFMILFLIIDRIFNISDLFIFAVFYFSVFSSIAEVSHYLCHSGDNKLAGFFSKSKIFLGKNHHGKHHTRDNFNYAFLNGMSDPLINIIAGKFYPGYKNTTDRHYLLYSGKGTNNRN